MSSPPHTKTNVSRSRYPRITKTTGLSDYIKRKKQLKNPKDSKWQWLTLAALVLALPAILFSVQNNIYKFTQGSQGTTATAVIVPYDTTITDFQDFRVLLHLPNEIIQNVNYSKISVIFDTSFLKVIEITPLTAGVISNSVETANSNGEITLTISGLNQTGLNAIAELKFSPNTNISSYTNINISPNSHIQISDNQTKLIKGNSASIKIIPN